MAGVAIVLGSAANALPDFAQARSFAPEAPVICVNDSIRFCPVKPIAFATLHPEKAHTRFFLGVDFSGVEIFAHEQPVYALRSKKHQYEWRLVPMRWKGTSGLYAGQVAIEALGFDGVIFAGVPIDSEAGAAYDLQGKTWASNNADRYRNGWRALPADMRARLRSVSGWTMKFLGAPDAHWIDAVTSARTAA